MHQCLIQRQGDDVEIVSADTTASIALADTPSPEFEGVDCLSGKVWEGEFLQISDFGLQPTQAVGSETSFLTNTRSSGKAELRHEERSADRL
jgi:hypothetical protein